MTEELFLIAHKVRGEVAFDVAIEIEIGQETGWIIPTSGHRAYPFWTKPLIDAKFGLADDCLVYEGFTWEDISDVQTLPEGLRDHYHTEAAPRPTGKLASLNLSDLGL